MSHPVPKSVPRVSEIKLDTPYAMAALSCPILRAVIVGHLYEPTMDTITVPTCVPNVATENKKIVTPVQPDVGDDIFLEYMDARHDADPENSRHRSKNQNNHESKEPRTKNQRFRSQELDPRMVAPCMAGSNGVSGPSYPGGSSTSCRVTGIGRARLGAGASPTSALRFTVSRRAAAAARP